MPTNNLTELETLDDRQRTVLADRLGITTCYELIMADRREVVDAFGRRANRPTLEQVAVWQDEARRKEASGGSASPSLPSAPSTESAGWQPIAAFVVTFEQRQRDDEIERQVVAEQTVGAAQLPHLAQRRSPDWAGDEIHEWMREQVGAPGGFAPIQAESAVSAPEPTERSATGAKVPLEPIDIDDATVTDSDGDIGVVANSRALPVARPIWIQPTRLIVALGGVQPGAPLVVALQLERAGEAKQTLVGDVDDTSRSAAIDLTGVANGEYAPTIVVRARDGSYLPRIVRLPAVGVTGSSTPSNLSTPVEGHD